MLSSDARLPRERRRGAVRPGEDFPDVRFRCNPRYDCPSCHRARWCSASCSRRFSCWLPATAPTRARGTDTDPWQCAAQVVPARATAFSLSFNFECKDENPDSDACLPARARHHVKRSGRAVWWQDLRERLCPLQPALPRAWPCARAAARSLLSQVAPFRVSPFERPPSSVAKRSNDSNETSLPVRCPRRALPAAHII